MSPGRMRQETTDSLLHRLNTFVAYLTTIFEHSSLYMHADDESEGGQSPSTWSEENIVDVATQLCLPFMRVAAVLQSHLFSEQVRRNIYFATPFCNNFYSVVIL